MGPPSLTFGAVMRNRLLLVACLVAIVGIAALWLRPDSRRTTDATSPSAAGSSQPVRSPETPAASVNAVPAPPAQLAIGPTTDPSGTFRTDPTGKLVVDEQTRLNMEALLARTAPADLPKLQQDIA